MAGFKTESELIGGSVENGRLSEAVPRCWRGRGRRYFIQRACATASAASTRRPARLSNTLGISILRGPESPPDELFRPPPFVNLAVRRPYQRPLRDQYKE